MKVNKDVIRQIILDFNEFNDGDVWMCCFEAIVEEFLDTQGGKYRINIEEELI